MQHTVEILPYRELERIPVPAAGWPLLLCIPPLAWFAATAAILSRVVGNEDMAGLALTVMLPTPFCAFYALRTYRRARQTWYVVTCLALNGIAAVITGTPLLLLWGWAMGVVWT